MIAVTMTRTKTMNLHVSEVAAFTTVLACACAAAPHAIAHDGHAGQRVVVERVVPAVAGVRVRAVAGGAGKLELSTSGSTTAEVLSAGGQPILRVGPHGAYANTSAPEWFADNEPLGIATVPPSATAAAPAHWRRIAAQRSWEWFDHRLHPAAGKVGRWSIPLRVAGMPVRISGRIEQSAGVLTVRPRIRSDLPPRVQVSAVDQPVAALRLRNDGKAAVDVLGADGELFARIGPRGVEVNVRSPVWVATAQYRNRDFLDAVIDPEAKPRLLAISPAPELIWPDPRLAPRAPLPSAAPAGQLEVAKWTVGLRTAGVMQHAIEGSTLLVAAAAGAAKSAPPALGAARVTSGPAGDGAGGGLVVVLGLAAACTLLSGGALVLRARG